MRSIPSHPDYRVTAEGQVWSTKRGGRWLRPSTDRRGYRRVTLSADGKVTTRTVHSLVAEAFIGPRPDGLEIRHLDGDPSNNAASNLAYGTHAENMQDKVRHGTDHNAGKTHCPAGHPYSGDNLRRTKKGRACYACIRERQIAARKWKPETIDWSRFGSRGNA